MRQKEDNKPTRKSLNEQTKNEIANILKEKEALLPCSRCGRTNFIISDGLGQVSINQNYDSASFVISSAYIPTIILICENCGLINELAIKILGLQIEKEEQNESGE